ncbi:PEP-CTERM sorting domain-containing protein [Pirellulimonas nuda]|uniref:PEP-CTERM sorting domain-containing protein n=1 Tax=Pirellulimonas nuda TaxID=2528009 RepID=UPI0018D40F49|nr:PEP-CTERM sorting domain-containing protein [Pirellulimonas nuda]
MSVDAANINVDFGTGGAVQTGLAAAPDAAGAVAQWNGTTGGSPSVASLLDSFGNATAVGMSVGSRGAFSAATPHSEVSAAAGVADLMTDYLTSRANSNQEDLRTGQITGLLAGSSYDLYFYGQGDNFVDTNNNGGQNVGVRIGADVRHTSWDGVVGGDGFLVEDIEYVVFRGIVADGAGAISFEHFNPGTGAHATDMSFWDSDGGANAVDMDGNASRFHALNGVQIVGTFPAPVPEPASLSLLLCAGIGMLAYRRRS